MRSLLVAVSWLVMTAGAVAHASQAHAAARVVALGGDITEIIYALDAGDALVGVDSTSEWPTAARRLPDVGYVRQLGGEGVLSLHPTLVIATHDAGPPRTITQLRAAGVRVEVMPVTRTPADIAAKVRAIGSLLDRADAAAGLATEIEDTFAALARDVAAMPRHPRVAFLLSFGAGSPMVAGTDTAASRAITWAGGRQAVTGYHGYKPMSAEAMVALKPDIIVVMRQDAGDTDAVTRALALPGVRQTPAGHNHRIVAVDGEALLGFGPRSAKQMRALQQAFSRRSP